METRDAPHLLPGAENSNSWRASVHGFLSSNQKDIFRDANMFSAQPQIKKLSESIINYLKNISRCCFFTSEGFLSSNYIQNCQKINPDFDHLVYDVYIYFRFSPKSKH